jgi:NADH:ubiquinone reductase (H+-translocating)
MVQVLIVGGGFAGLNAAKGLGGVQDVEVTIVDKSNHHLFQPLLYQVAMAGLSPADIAVPIRSLLAKYKNIRVLQGEIRSLHLGENRVEADFGSLQFDYLISCCGARHSYFKHEEWEEFAPGLKTLEQATEIRRRVLTAYEAAERSDSAADRKRLLTFVIVGGGPTGVELAGAIGEMSRFTLAKDFRNINAAAARVILIETGPRILSMFSESLASHAARDLEQLGVQVWTNSMVTKIDADGVEVGSERILSATVLWAAGVQASPLGKDAGLEVDRQGRVVVENDLSIKSHPNAFFAGDQACFMQADKPLPGVAPVATQQGQYLAKLIRREVKLLAIGQSSIDQPRAPFKYVDKGSMATIGRSRAIVEVGSIKVTGFMAWMMWLLVHIYFLTGFRNRTLVVLQWGWSYLSFRRGARLIVNKQWRQHPQRPDL